MNRRVYREPIYAQYATHCGRQDIEACRRSRLPFLSKVIRDHCEVDRRSRVLDVGCGDGSFLLALQKHGFSDLTGVDVSSEQVAAARALSIGAIHQSDIASFLDKEPSESFGLIIAFDVLEHFGKEEVVTILASLARILRQDGRLLVHVPNGGSPFGGRVLYGDFTHEIAFTQQSLSQLLLALGFSSVTCYEDVPSSRGPLGLARRVLWRLVRAFYIGLVTVESGGVGSNNIFSQNLLCVAHRRPLPMGSESAPS